MGATAALGFKYASSSATLIEDVSEQVEGGESKPLKWGSPPLLSASRTRALLSVLGSRVFPSPTAACQMTQSVPRKARATSETMGQRGRKKPSASPRPSLPFSSAPATALCTAGATLLSSSCAPPCAFRSARKNSSSASLRYWAGRTASFAPLLACLLGASMSFAMTTGRSKILAGSPVTALRRLHTGQSAKAYRTRWMEALI
mmetsp:Transcript_56644/g.165684  ORF Transcript_56644/g.165684 Transcript_56644/m.165684 type:complete len:203 (-) Transcript_56644:1567-2175(-)